MRLSAGPSLNRADENCITLKTATGLGPLRTEALGYRRTDLPGPSALIALYGEFLAECKGIYSKGCFYVNDID